MDAQGKLRWSRRADLIRAEALRDGLYLLGTNATPEQLPAANSSPGMGKAR